MTITPTLTVEFADGKEAVFTIDPDLLAIYDKDGAGDWDALYGEMSEEVHWTHPNPEMDVVNFYVTM